MLNKHFFKTVILFSGMILLGLLGIFLVSYYGNLDVDSENNADIAK